MLDKGLHGGSWLFAWVGMLLVFGFDVGGARAAGEQAAAGMRDTAARYVLDLSRAWRLALENDHVYRAAISEQAASQTERAQGRAGLLPQIEAGYYRSLIKGSATQPDILSGQPLGSRLDYDSLSAYVQLQQPILNYERYADYRRGEARADMGMAAFLVKSQQTGVRLATAYFNALLAYDGRQLQRSLADSLASQAALIDARFRQHEATRIDAQETAARLAVARADLIEAEDEWIVALRELEALVGVAPTHLAGLRDDFPLPSLVPATLNEWLEIALAGNTQVQAARQAVRVAGAEVDMAASRYLPTTDLVAVYGRAKSENLSSLSQRTNTFSIGVQINIPLFAGGYNRANVARARSERIQRQYELQGAVEQAMAEVTRQYTNVRAGADHIKALRQAVASGELSLTAAVKGFSLGVSSNLEVLKVQDRLYQTRYELAQAQLEYLLAHLKLHAAAGGLKAGVFDGMSDIYLDKPVPVSSDEARDSLLVSYAKK